MSLFGSVRGQTERQEIIPTPVETKKVSKESLSGKYDKDVAAIQSRYGRLKPGLCIETTLQDLLSIAPRHRQRVDAYNGLVNYLFTQYGVKLTIKSRKSNDKRNFN